MRKLALALAATLALSAHAADPERLREAHALFGTMHLETQFDAIASGMGQAMSQQFGKPGDDPRAMQIFMSEAMAVMKEQMLKPGGTIDAMAEAYADIFSLDELQEVHRFYASPAGQKMLSKVPQLMPRVMQQSMARMKESLPVICSRSKERMLAEGLESSANKLKCP